MDYGKIKEEIREILTKHGRPEHVNYYDQLFMLMDGELFNKVTAKRKRIRRKSFEKWLSKVY